MAKIGPIFSIILPATTTEFQPEVLRNSPLCLYPFGNSYTYCGAGFGSSKIMSRIYFGSLEGKMEIKVLSFLLVYVPFSDLRI